MSPKCRYVVLAMMYSFHREISGIAQNGKKMHQYKNLVLRGTARFSFPIDLQSLFHIKKKGVNSKSCAKIEINSATKKFFISTVRSLLLLQRRPCAVKEKLNHLAHGLFCDCPRDQLAPLAIVQINAQHLDDPRLALCAALGALNLMFCLFDQVKHQRLDRCAVAQTDKPQHKRHSAHNDEHQRQPRGQRGENSVKNGFHVLLSSLFFEIFDAVVCHLDLLFQHWHALGKVVVRPDFSGQLFQLSFGDGLLLVQLGVHTLSGAVVGDDHADQAQTAGDDCHDDCFAHAPSRRRVRPFLAMILA
nr:MAG TPA: hypothetical protein [Caudoviricetes sp.]